MAKLHWKDVAIPKTLKNKNLDSSAWGITDMKFHSANTAPYDGARFMVW
jgi:hypothetical protein